MDPVTYKPFTDNSHIVALKTSGNVFTWDTVERLNIKAKNWRDLVSDTDFSRKDIITLQDPQNLAARDLSSFKYVKDGISTLTDEQARERADPNNKLNLSAMGSSAKILRAKEAVLKAREDRAITHDPNHFSTRRKSIPGTTTADSNTRPTTSMAPPRKTPAYNAAQHTTGQAAASFTSTGLTPYTSGERALLSDEEYMLKPRRVKQRGYARICTNHGDLSVELNTEFAPKAVWNFVHLAKKGYYKDVAFHRNIRNFMLQGGDPTGTGRGGQSIWGKSFADEFAQSPLTHNARGVVSMANKGKNTNTSQFFITYRATPHLDRKHTIFGQIMDLESGGAGAAVLKELENAETDSDDRPADCVIQDVVIFVDPFEEILRDKAARDGAEQEEEEISRQGGREDDNTTWTGKRLRSDGKVVEDDGGGIGKYLETSTEKKGHKEVIEEYVEEWEGDVEVPAPKKRKAGAFGNFDSW